MSSLHEALVDYLAMRRALGYKLEREGKLLPQFVDFVEDRGEQHLSTQAALAWATLSGGLVLARACSACPRAWPRCDAEHPPKCLTSTWQARPDPAAPSRERWGRPTRSSLSPLRPSPYGLKAPRRQRAGEIQWPACSAVVVCDRYGRRTRTVATTG